MRPGAYDVHERIRDMNHNGILSSQVSSIAAQDLLWGGAFVKYSKLKVAWSEGGVGWIPFYDP